MEISGKEESLSGSSQSRDRFTLLDQGNLQMFFFYLHHQIWLFGFKWPCEAALLGHYQHFFVFTSVDQDLDYAVVLHQRNITIPEIPIAEEYENV